ncbi:MAG: hypothetical protein BAJALOKI1v1_1450004 [Promethearchaeota archaeon]|nr:MAG: hypothetical protein BAJALOKI1v1_1450004 [Candidatus Lokiarchaeota archaeon]
MVDLSILNGLLSIIHISICVIVFVVRVALYLETKSSQSFEHVKKMDECIVELQTILIFYTHALVELNKRSINLNRDLLECKILEP